MTVDREEREEGRMSTMNTGEAKGYHKLNARVTAQMALGLRITYGMTSSVI